MDSIIWGLPQKKLLHVLSSDVLLVMLEYVKEPFLKISREIVARMLEIGTCHILICFGLILVIIFNYTHGVAFKCLNTHFLSSERGR